MAEFNQNLKDHITQSLAQGKSKEDIYKELIQQGWKIDVIEQYFGTPAKTPEIQKTKEERDKDTQSKAVKIFLFVGVILIGAGIFSFIASNWQGMPRSLKVGIIVIGMAVSYSAGWYFKEKRGQVKTGEALILLGSLIYGGGIFLVGQMFNIRANWPDGFILWMLGTLLLAFAIESYPLFYLSIVLSFVAIFSHPFLLLSPFITRDHFLLTSTILLIITTAATFATAIIMRKKVPSEHKDFF